MNRRTFLLAISAMPLAGCNWRPLYGTSAGAVSASLREVDVAAQTTRLGQLVRNAFLAGIPPAAEGGGRYLLAFTAREDVQETVVASTSDAKQYRYRLLADFTLKDKRSGKVVLKGSTFADTSYLTTRLPLADRQAKEHAQQAAARTLADALRARVAAWLGTAR